MAASAFDDKSAPPSTGQLASTLGRASHRWTELVETLARQYAPLSETWKYGGKQWGWALQLQHKKRTVVWLTPCRRHFIAGLALGKKAVHAAHKADLPAPVLAVIDGARQYAEGRAVRLEVRSKGDVAVVVKVATAKMAN